MIHTSFQTNLYIKKYFGSNQGIILNKDRILRNFSEIYLLVNMPLFLFSF